MKKLKVDKRHTNLPPILLKDFDHFESWLVVPTSLTVKQLANTPSMTTGW